MEIGVIQRYNGISRYLDILINQCWIFGCYPYDMEKKLYEIIAELLREQNLISDSEFKRIGRLIQSEYGGKITCERKDE